MIEESLSQSPLVLLSAMKNSENNYRIVVNLKKYFVRKAPGKRPVEITMIERESFRILLHSE